MTKQQLLNVRARRSVVGVIAGACLAVACGQALAEPAAAAAFERPSAKSPHRQSPQFVLSVPGSPDGATFPPQREANGGSCHSDNVSPPLAWTGVPAGTRSFAVVMSDPDGRSGLGVVHWIHYGLPGDLTQLAEGAGTAADLPGRGGRNSGDTLDYHGPCPPLGEVAHHYVIQVFALDLSPEALPLAMKREALFAAMDGHVLAATSVVQRYGR
ncbi:YbhB/YbcL family Raf kinase inhibitor-like protein [Robbsia sp. Bb-Pol-6]|uniref:YbhB/YbcL family Raf kinase inhibitor-like protein n=1 Tax=Robbsia betulipollinis TaxID=2981849 RepID=A0ABT3ZRP4_9BURK|nr:YbhB/YbcL family Raf kinase inhibitor-like protein [Robbsia betulipollinis]MCY0389229.1 YbhB/YbcL family Raf kinase inhibitor-like protein [Robbsia betulipollinis]